MFKFPSYFRNNTIASIWTPGEQPGFQNERAGGACLHPAAAPSQQHHAGVGGPHRPRHLVPPRRGALQVPPPPPAAEAGASRGRGSQLSRPPSPHIYPRPRPPARQNRRLQVRSGGCGTMQSCSGMAVCRSQADSRLQLRRHGHNGTLPRGAVCIWSRSIELPVSRMFTGTYSHSIFNETARDRHSGRRRRR